MGTEHDLDPWYVTGFVEGEGVFTYSRSGRQLSVVFAIRVSGSNRVLLDALRSYLGDVGRVYAGRDRKAAARGGPMSTCYFRVTRPAELLRIVGHLDAYPLRGDKLAVYAIWREMVLVRAAHHGRRPPAELLELADRLSSAAPRSRRG